MKKIKTLIFMWIIVYMLTSNVSAFSSNEIDNFTESDPNLVGLLVWIIVSVIIIISIKIERKKNKDNKKIENIKPSNIEDKEEVLFKNITNVKEEEINIFKEFIKKHNRDRRINIIYFNIVFGLILAAISIENKKIWILNTFIIIMVILIIFKKTKEVLYKEEEQKREDVLINYEFYNGYMVRYTNNKSNTNTSFMKISFKEIAIKNICRYKEFIFLMIAPNESYVINENNFTIGNKEEFDKYIQNKFNMKIKYYN